ncbi:MAG: hypothetical protein ACI9UT_001530 [Flavobacteriales bacterium]|jgi:hypothetical protein
MLKKQTHIGVTSVIFLTMFSFSAPSFADSCERYERKYEQAKRDVKEKKKWYEGAKWQYKQQGTSEWKRRMNSRWEEFDEAQEREWRYEDLINDNC